MNASNDYRIAVWKKYMMNLQKQIRICTVVIKNMKILTKMDNIFNRLFQSVMRFFGRVGKRHEKKREVSI